MTKIIKKLKPQEGPQEQFCNLSTDVPLVFYGGAAGGGKSWSILLYLLRFTDDPEFFAVCFRKTLRQLELALFKEAKSMYRPLITDKYGKFIGKAKINDSKGNYKITFPSGAVISFSYLTCMADAEQWAGTELSAICFDEFTDFDQETFNFMKTRLRSKAGCDSFVRCSMNPHPNHFVKDSYIAPYLITDENDPLCGVIDKKLNGKLRYFLFDTTGAIHTSWDKEELELTYNTDYARTRNTDDLLCPAQSYTVIGSALSDNQELTRSNKNYETNLRANGAANKARLLGGNWLYVPPGDGIFDPLSVKEITYADLPLSVVTARGWDKAATEANVATGNNPDWTASVKFKKDREGNLYVLGDYITDEKGDQMARFRMKPGERDLTIKAQCQHDGDDTYVVLPQDPGQAGITETLNATKKLQASGFIVHKDPMPGNKSKSKRFEPFCSACTAGNVYFVVDSFDKDTLTYYYLELENFDGDKNNGYKDDLVDATASTYNWIVRKRVNSAVRIPIDHYQTAVSKFKATQSHRSFDNYSQNGIIRHNTVY